MSITEEDIRKQLSQTILPEDDVVVVYSGLWMFGSLLGLAIKDIPDVLLNIFLDFLGHERTLLLPTYSYAYTSSRVYDLKRSRAETGVLPAHALRRKDFTRTMSPLNSYAVSGSSQHLFAFPSSFPEYLKSLGYSVVDVTRLVESRSDQYTLVSSQIDLDMFEIGPDD